MCIQGLLNYLLIELRKDKNLPKFWETVMMIIEELELKKAVEKYSQKRPICKYESMNLLTVNVMCDPGRNPTLT